MSSVGAVGFHTAADSSYKNAVYFKSFIQKCTFRNVQQTNLS